MRPKTLLSFAALLTIPMLLLTASLFRNMSEELVDMLPLNSPYLKDLANAAERIHGRESLVLWIESPDAPQAGNKLQEVLTKKFENAHLPSVQRVESRVGDEFKFFYDRIGFFLTKKDLNEIEKEITSQYEKRRHRNPDPESPAWTPGVFEEIFRTVISQYLPNRLSGFLGRYTRFKNGWYRSPDNKVNIIFLRASVPSLKLSNALALQEQVDKIVSDTKKEDPAFSAVSVRYSGDYRHIIEDHESIFRDIGVTSFIVLILVGYCVWYFIRSVRDIFYIFASLGFGVLLCMSISYFIFKPMNANAAFMISIVVGNGINFGIILLSRIRETGTIQQSIQETRVPTLLAMLGGIMAYGSLALTEFRGFQQFGILGVLGMFSCWLSAYMLIPQFIRLFEKEKIIQWPEPATIKITPSIKTYGRLGLVFVAFFSLVAFTVPQFALTFETDLQKLRDKHNITEGSIALGAKIAHIFNENLTPFIVMTSNREQARDITRKLTDRTDKDNLKAKITNVISLDMLVPEDQNNRLNELKELTRRLAHIPKHYLTQKESQLITQLKKTIELGPFTENDLPKEAVDLFTEKNGEKGRIIYLESKSLRQKQMLGDTQKFVFAVNKHLSSAGEGSAVIGSAVLVLILTEIVEHETKRVTLWLLLLVGILIFSLYRNLRESIWILTAWASGVAFFIALILISGTKIHMINFLAVPITLGIGVDYAANLRSRLKKDGFFKAYRPVLLCSLTTILGYAALLTAGNLGLRSFAWVAMFGEFACLLLSGLWGLNFLQKPDIENQ